MDQNVRQSIGGTILWWERDLGGTGMARCQSRMQGSNRLFYGDDRGDTSLYPLVWFNNGFRIVEYGGSPADVRSVASEQTLFCSDLVRLVRGRSTSEKVWDQAKEQLVATFEHLGPVVSLPPTNIV